LEFYILKKKGIIISVRVKEVDKGLRLGACCLLHPTQQGCCRRCPVPSKEHL